MRAGGLVRRGKGERHSCGLDRRGTVGGRYRLEHAETGEGSKRLLLVSLHFSGQTGGISTGMLDLLFQKRHSVEARGETVLDAVDPVICRDESSRHGGGIGSLLATRVMDDQGSWELDSLVGLESHGRMESLVKSGIWEGPDMYLLYMLLAGLSAA